MQRERDRCRDQCQLYLTGDCSSQGTGNPGTLKIEGASENAIDIANHE